MTLTVMSDLHLSKKPWPVRRALKLGAGADVVLLVGDLVNDGTPEQMELMHRCIEEALPDTPVLSVAGNHDYPRRPNATIRQGICDYPALQDWLLDRQPYVHEAYRDWYFCQRDTSVPEGDGLWLKHGHKLNISWLSYLPEMHQRRAPGNTCMSALGSGDWGTMDKPINHSKGCGGIMRVAPVALYYNYIVEQPQWLEDMCATAAKTAALTHGHPLGYMPAAALAHIISRAAFGGCPYGNGLHGILKECKELMQEMFDDEPQTAHLPTMLSLMERAEKLAANDKPDAENIESLGGGWVAEETLAIAIYCCLKYPDDFSRAVIAAVNHSGDSDSTGAITGNIMGAWLGYEKVDPVWLKDLELRGVIEEVAADLCDHCRMSEYGDYRDEDWERKYINFGNKYI